MTSRGPMNRLLRTFLRARAAFALVILASVFPAQLRAQDHANWRWRTSDTVREAVVLGVSAVDWSQTLGIEEANERGLHLHEMNPILGRHPSRGQINRYFAASLLAHVVVARLLPQRMREAFQYLSIGFELEVTAHNAKMGCRITF